MDGKVVVPISAMAGVGENAAKAIVEEYKNRPFETIEEIQNVKGIGYQDYIRLQPLITVK